jgi:arylsulfatase A-like enzyme
MNRSHPSSGVMAWGIFLALGFGGVLAQAKEGRPNIILVMCDDLGWGDTGFQGSRVIQTPHLDELAAESLRFTRFYAAAPVCSPTRGSCLTGRHPYRYGIYFANVGHLPEEELTLAELLREHGYATGHFGKWHLGTLTTEIVESNRGGPRGAAHFSPPWKNGFDTCFSTEAKVPTWDPMLRPRRQRSQTWWDPVDDLADAEPYGTHYWTNGEMVTENLRGANARVIMDRALPFIRGAVEDDRPFFAVVWFHEPHLPVVAGPQYTAMYPERSRYEQHYFGCITAMDEQIGRLRTELETLGVAGDTLIAFTSDNGPEGDQQAPGSAGGLRGRKRSLFEGGVRVPSLIAWPGRIEPGVTEIPASTSDYLPTIVAILGAEFVDDRPIDGVNLLPLFRGQMDQRPAAIGFESGKQIALIDNRWKLLRIGDGDYMLFDLVADPAETQDVATEHAERVAQMARKLDAWRASCKDSVAGKDYVADSTENPHAKESNDHAIITRIP